MLGLTPNRVAAIGSVTTDAGAAVLAVTHSLPGNYQATAVLIAALLAKSGVVLKYLQGAQNWDRIQADATMWLTHAPPTYPAAEDSETTPVTIAEPTPEQAWAARCQG